MSGKVLSTANKELTDFHKEVNSNKIPSNDIFESLNHIKLKINEHKINERGYLSLVIKYLIKCNNKDWLRILLDENLENLRINDCLALTKYFDYCNEIDKSEMFFSIHYKYYHYSSKSIEFFIINNMKKYLYCLDGYYTNLNEKKLLEENKIRKINNKEYCKLKNYYRSKNIFNRSNKNSDISIEYFVNKIVDKFTSETNKIKQNDRINKFFLNLDRKYSRIDNDFICLDCGNILHCIGGEISNKGYLILIEMIEKLFEIGYIPIIIIHRRHLDKKYSNRSQKILNYINIIVEKYKDLIFETPYKENDDYYIFLISIIGGFKIISKDTYGDHLQYLRNDKKDNYFQIDFLIKDLLVVYNIGSSLEISFSKNLIKNYSNCIQIINGQIFIPTTNGEFVLVK
tara:strand:- start:1242 stop:2441 length:1200 start_codon:yes stop_codon:yes gene_type:complete